MSTVKVLGSNKKKYAVHILNDKEFDALPFKNVKDSLGCANPKTKTAYIRRTGHDAISKLIDTSTLEHEMEELVSKHSDHEDEDGIRYKSGRDFAGNLVQGLVSVVTSALGPVVGAVGGAAGSALGATIRQERAIGKKAIAGGVAGGLSGLVGGTGNIVGGAVEGATSAGLQGVMEGERAVGSSIASGAIKGAISGTTAQIGGKLVGSVLGGAAGGAAGEAAGSTVAPLTAASVGSTAGAAGTGAFGASLAASSGSALGSALAPVTTQSLGSLLGSATGAIGAGSILGTAAPSLGAGASSGIGSAIAGGASNAISNVGGMLSGAKDKVLSLGSGLTSGKLFGLGGTSPTGAGSSLLGTAKKGLTNPMTMLGLGAMALGSMPTKTEVPNIGEITSKWLTPEAITKSGAAAKDVLEGRYGGDFVPSGETVALIDTIHKDIDKSYARRSKDMDRMGAASNQNWMTSGERLEMQRRLMQDQEEEKGRVEVELMANAQQQHAKSQFEYVMTAWEVDEAVKRDYLYADLATVMSRYNADQEDVLNFRKMASDAGLYLLAQGTGMI